MGPLRDPNPRATLWLYTEPTENSANAGVASSPTTAKDKAADIIEEIKGTVNTEETPKEFRQPDLRKLELKNYPEGHDFHPLGIEIWPSYGGNGSYLYAVNHARARTVIEQFLLDPADLNSATHIRTISHPWFISPNALALTSPDSFYVSNDHLFTRRLPILGKFLPFTETILALPFSFVAHVTLNPPFSPPSSPTIKEHTIEAPFPMVSRSLLAVANLLLRLRLLIESFSTFVTKPPTNSLSRTPYLYLSVLITFDIMHQNHIMTIPRNSLFLDTHTSRLSSRLLPRSLERLVKVGSYLSPRRLKHVPV